MGKITKIEWTDSTWNPFYGCTPVSAGCRECFARRSWRLLGLKPGEVRRAADATFYAPLKWYEPRRIFVCSISDFFHEKADYWREEAFRVMAECQWHTFIIPTKRTERMIECIYGETTNFINAGDINMWDDDHLPNVFILASVENQEMADKRIPELLRLREYGDWPVLGVSVEPMLEKIDLSKWVFGYKGLLDWVICGGESGPLARPCHPDWVRLLRNQSIAANTPFFFKQWGEWAPQRITGVRATYQNNLRWGTICDDGEFFESTTPWNGNDDDGRGEAVMIKAGKKLSGCLLDGHVWYQIPGETNG